MNFLTFNQQSAAAQIFALAQDGAIAMRTDEAGYPVLKVSGTQTIVATDLDIRDLDGANDTAAITAGNFAIRPLEGSRDSLELAQNNFYVTSDTATLLLGGTVVLTVDTAPYANSALMVRADAISLLTSVYLQLAPVNTDSYFENRGLGHGTDPEPKISAAADHAVALRPHLCHRHRLRSHGLLRGAGLNLTGGGTDEFPGFQ